MKHSFHDPWWLKMLSLSCHNPVKKKIGLENHYYISKYNGNKKKQNLQDFCFQIQLIRINILEYYNEIGEEN